MNVSIIVPVYNGEKYIEKLFNKIRQQKNISKIEIIAPVSFSIDKSLEVCKKFADKAYEVKKFNHGKTRHEAALQASGDYLVFITQDIMPYDELWLYNLLKNLNKNIIAAFSKQIAYPEHGEIEKLIREFNYPDKKRMCNLQNERINGRKNIFYSNASSAVIKSEFFNINGYNFEVLTNEDVIFANNVIKGKKSFIYQPESKIYHSHKLSLKETYERYKLIGQFESIYSKKIDFSNTNNEGKKLILFVIKNLLKNRRIIELYNFGVDILIRLLGYRKGQKWIQN